MKDLKDNFSAQAGAYAAFRPHYPEALFDFLFALTPRLENAWDCGTGNGQVAVQLARRFRQVYASDISEKQLQQAAPRENVSYVLSRAEQTNFPDHTFDLITVAQAIHWFDFDAFYQEVNRTARPGAMLAVWGYNLLRIEPAIDRIVSHFYERTIGPYWDAERRYVDESYLTLPFPFEEIPAPPFAITVQWSLAQLLGYLSSWSSVQRYIRVHGHNPVEPLAETLVPHWPDGTIRPVSFPIFCRIGKVAPSAGL